MATEHYSVTHGELIRQTFRTKSRTLKYEIHESSACSGKYVAENILFDVPDDKSSRWSCPISPQHPQWITLRLEESCVLKEIIFGKTSGRHPCNLKDFKVYAGLEPDHLVELLHTGLNNDSVPEAFCLRHQTNEGMIMPTRYVKIVPLATHQADYNASIWFVALKGIADPEVVRPITEQYAEYREETSLRMVAKHLRSRQLPYQDILRRADVQLEHPIVASLFDTIVCRGDLSCAETVVEKAESVAPFYREYLFASPPLASWSALHDSEASQPCPRGGHQMALDVPESTIYLFGGWTGKEALNDLWSYSLREQRWTLLSSDTSTEGGPGPRSCHAMTLDGVTKTLYILGNRLETPTWSDGVCKSDFWEYSIPKRTWTQISDDTQVEGGPPLVYDHGMVMDSHHGLIVVFGGKIIDPDSGRNARPRTAGMYTYNVGSKTWRLEFDDPSAQTSMAVAYIPSRSGHGMILDENERIVYIFGGSRTLRAQTQLVADMWTYSLVTGEIGLVSSDCSAQGGPDPGYCGRLLVDDSAQELYVVPGLIQDRTSDQRSMQRAVYIYSMIYKRWTRVEEVEPLADQGLTIPVYGQSPDPRYAHQVIFDPHYRKPYVHGGNNGVDDTTRLGDFWSVSLERMHVSEVFRRAKFVLRRQRFMELSRYSTAVEALKYLQSEVHEMVNHQDAKEAKEFHRLAKLLLNRPMQPLITSKDTDVPMTDAQDIEMVDEVPEMEPVVVPPMEGDWRMGFHSLSDQPSIPTTISPTHSAPSPSQAASRKRPAAAMASSPEARPTETILTEYRDVTTIPRDLFQERYEVFQTLMDFIDSWAKEPQGDLTAWITQELHKDEYVM